MSSIQLAGADLENVLDLALEGAIARKARGEEIDPASVAALARLVEATEEPPALLKRLQVLVPGILRGSP